MLNIKVILSVQIWMPVPPPPGYNCIDSSWKQKNLKPWEIWFWAWPWVWCYWLKEEEIKTDNFWRPKIDNYLIILRENIKFKKWIFTKDDVILKDSLNPNLIIENYNWTTYNLWNLCYQNYKPSIFDYSINLTSCDTIKSYWERWDFTWFSQINEELCFPHLDSKKFKVPELKKCWYQEYSWVYYENCCPFQEYDLLMLIRSKIKSKEIKTKDDMIKFVRTENQRYEQSQKEIPKKIQDFEGISFVSIIFLFLIIFIKLFKSKKAS